jgi:tetratricopeptide (TPR) repeat protein
MSRSGPSAFAAFRGRMPLRGLPMVGRQLGRCLASLALVVWPTAVRTAIAVSTHMAHLGMGDSGMSEKHNGALLLAYFKTFLDDRDGAAFRDRVSARYNEGTLGRILASSPDPAARRAAVLSLGILGSFKGSNAVLAHALCDNDQTVRSMAEDALWAIWYRAGSPEHNQMLSQVRRSISRQQLEQAEALVDRLVKAAPDFAEAYNQRAIIYFLQGRFAESVSDCQTVLERNPYHFGAISGLAQCQIQLNRPRDALKALRRALKLQPYHATLREDIRLLETQLGSDGVR